MDVPPHRAAPLALEAFELNEDSDPFSACLGSGLRRSDEGDGASDRHNPNVVPTKVGIQIRIRMARGITSHDVAKTRCAGTP